MNYFWTNLDGVEISIETPSEIRAVLDDIASRYAEAVAAGQNGAATALKLHWQEQHREWRRCSRHYYNHQKLQIRRLEEEVRRKLDWWSESVSTKERPDKPSKLQLELLGEIPADVAPTTWERAAQIINLMPGYSPPLPENNPGIVNAARAALALGPKLRELAEELKTCFETDIPTQEQLNDYSSSLAQFTKAVADFDALH